MSVKIAISTALSIDLRSRGAADHVWYQMLDGRRADLLHGGVELDAQQLQHALDAGLAERTETPDVGPPDADRARAETQRLDDVGAAAESGVDQDRDAATDRFDDFRQRVDGGAPG